MLASHREADSVMVRPEDLRPAKLMWRNDRISYYDRMVILIVRYFMLLKGQCDVYCTMYI